MDTIHIPNNNIFFRIILFLLKKRSGGSALLLQIWSLVVDLETQLFSLCLNMSFLNLVWDLNFGFGNQMSVFPFMVVWNNTISPLRSNQRVPVFPFVHISLYIYIFSSLLGKFFPKKARCFSGVPSMLRKIPSGKMYLEIR